MAPTQLSSGQLSALLTDLARVPEAVPAAAWGAGLRPGARLGRYELGAELGRGSFGVVYEALDREDRTTVALKVVRPGKAEAAAVQLQREADAIASLSHPNLVALLDVGRCDAGPYLVLERLRGRTLKARLAEGPLQPEDALAVALGVARGLAHAHGQGVVHRDLKPSNVYLCADGSVRILDFGLAHAFGRRRLDGGTPDFMAPEQWRGAPEDERTDVFALGVLAYLMLAGELPFPEDGGRSVTSPHPAPALEVEGVPGLGALLSRMLAKDPVDRPRDAAAVAEALEILHPAGGSTAGSTVGSTAGSTAGSRSGLVRIRRARRRRRAALLAAAAALGLAATLAALAWRGGGPQGAEALPSLAVLPFADLSGEGEPRRFAAGLADELLNSLAQLEGLRVVGRASSLAPGGQASDLPALGRRLGVGHVLDGSVRLEGERVRVTTRLVRVSDGVQLWSEAYERRLAGIFAVQEELAGAVAGEVGARLVASRPVARPAAEGR